MIIVTGGAGFIGSNILDGLERQRYKDLVVIDTLGCEDKWKNIAKRELAAIVAPENALEYLNAHKDEIQAIIHMGAISTTTEKDVDLIIRSNFQLSWDMWCFCRDNNKQFIYASSAATYGDGNKGFDDEDNQLYLNNLRPLNPYGWSKALFDRKVCRERDEKRKLPKQDVGLKFFNVYGPRQNPESPYSGVLSIITECMKNNKPFTLYGDGLQTRDFVYVGDVVNALIKLATETNESTVYNIANGGETTLIDVIRTYEDISGIKLEITYKDSRHGDIKKSKADISKLKNVGFEPQWSLEDGLRNYWKYYSEN